MPLVRECPVGSVARAEILLWRSLEQPKLHLALRRPCLRQAGASLQGMLTDWNRPVARQKVHPPKALPLLRAVLVRRKRPPMKLRRRFVTSTVVLARHPARLLATLHRSPWLKDLPGQADRLPRAAPLSGLAARAKA